MSGSLSTVPAPSATAWPFVARGEQVDALAAVLARGDTDVLHLSGPSGVGKTRLATALLEWAEADGYAVARVRGSRSAAAIPMSAVSAILPPAVLDRPAPLLLASALEHLRDLGDGSPVVVLVDDVDLLDHTSLAVLSRCIEERVVQLITTARDDAALPDVLLATSRQGRLGRVEVKPLDRISVATLLHVALEGAVSAPLERALWEMSGGSPLYLRELVRAGWESGALRELDGVWTLAAPLTTPGSLRELVAERLGELGATARTALELLALCSVLGVHDLEEATEPGIVEELEASGLVEVEAEGRRLSVRLAHPTYGQVLRETMPSLRARRLLLGQVQRVEAHGARRRGDLLRVARWRLETTGTADAALLIEAARLARVGHDYAEVERLCRAVLTLGPNVAASALLGESLYEDGRFAESDAAFADAVAAARPEDVISLAVPRALNLYLGLGRLDDALTSLQEARQRAEAGGASQLLGAQALLLTQGGRTAAAGELLEELPPGAGGELAARARALVLLRTGDVLEAERAARRAWLSAADDAQVLHPAGSLMVAALALLADGNLAGARSAATEGATAAAEQGVEFQALLLRWVGALVDLAAGDLGGAGRRAAEVIATATAGGFASAVRLGLAAATIAAAQRGALPEVRSFQARLARLDVPRELYASWVTIADGWAQVAIGEVPLALAAWRSAADRFLDQGELLGAVDVLHEAVRLGDRAAAEQLVEVGAGVAGSLAEARVLQAQGVLGDLDALRAAADRYAALGLHLVAAEAATTAARREALARRERQRLAALAATERAHCPQAATPALAAAPTSAGLTARELHVARMAAAGQTSKAIAEALGLSSRTVDNHLQNAYTKLGISRRDQLAGALRGEGLTNASEARP